MLISRTRTPTPVPHREVNADLSCDFGISTTHDPVRVMLGRLSRADREAANRAEAALETLAYPWIRPQNYRFVLHRAGDGVRLADGDVLSRTRCGHEMTWAFLEDELAGGEEGDTAVLAAVFHKNHCGELECGDSITITEHRDISRAAVGTVQCAFFRPRDNRTAWVVLAVDEDEHGLLAPTPA